MGGNPPDHVDTPPEAPKREGALADSETLAIFLAVGFVVADEEIPRNRVELLELWEGKREEIREAYRHRAKRLLRTWADARRL